MSNLICFTQDVPGEREWLASLFPEHLCLETASSGKWQSVSNEQVIWEVPCSDYNAGIGAELDGVKVKTVFQQKLPTDVLLNDTGWIDAEQLYLHNQVNFADANLGSPVSRYQMFTFARCGTVFTESLLLKKYPRIEHHYVLENNQNRIVDQCQNTETLICLLYRRDWWAWLVSNIISEHNDYYHYDSTVDFSQLNSVEIGSTQIEQYEERIKSIFNFWCNLRMCLPMHQFKIFEFAEVIRQNQKATAHKKIPYEPSTFVLDHDKSKLFFESNYLPRWQEIEKNSLNHLSSMKVNVTSTI
jgi:hypothetical protein